MASAVNRVLISPSEYARRRGVSRPAVSKAIRRCGIPLVDGKLDPLVADTLWAARTDPDQARRGLAQNANRGAVLPAPADPTAADWRNRREAAEAQIAELNLRKAAGELVERARIAQELSRRIAALEVQFDALPDRAAAALGVNDEHRRTVRQFVRDELAQIRKAVADMGMPEVEHAG